MLILSCAVGCVPFHSCDAAGSLHSRRSVCTLRRRAFHEQGFSATTGQGPCCCESDGILLTMSAASIRVLRCRCLAGSPAIGGGGRSACAGRPVVGQIVWVSAAPKPAHPLFAPVISLRHDLEHPQMVKRRTCHNAQIQKPPQGRHVRVLHHRHGSLPNSCRHNPRTANASSAPV